MRLPALLLVTLLAFASDLAFRPLWDLGTATPDPPLLLVLWLALHDRRRRLHLIVCVIALARARFGLTPLLATWAPLALAAELLFFARHFFDLRPAYFRYPTLAAAVSIHIAVTDLLVRRQLHDHLLTHLLVGAVTSAVAAIIFFPVLHATRPLLRSPEYPLYEGTKR